MPANTQHRPVTAYNQSQVAARANLWHIDQRIARQARVVRCFALQQDLASLRSQILRDVFQHASHGVGLPAGKAGMVLTNQRHVAEY